MHVRSGLEVHPIRVSSPHIPLSPLLCVDPMRRMLAASATITLTIGSEVEVGYAGAMGSRIDARSSPSRHAGRSRGRWRRLWSSLGGAVVVDPAQQRGGHCLAARTANAVGKSSARLPFFAIHVPYTCLARASVFPSQRCKSTPLQLLVDV